MFPLFPLVPLLPIPVGGGGPVPPVVVSGPTGLAVNAPAEAVHTILRTDGTGQIIWGSLDSQTANTSIWSFIRYLISPDQNLMRSRGLSVDTEMDVLPEDNPDFEWFQGASFGQGTITGAGPTFLNLKATAASPDLYYAFYYQRIEPFLGYQAIFDLDARYLVDYGTRGSGDARIAVQDTTRYIEVGNLLYLDQQPSKNRIRRLINNPSLSFAGLYAPTSDPSTANAWTSDGFIRASSYERVLTTQMAHPLGAGAYSGTLDPYIVPISGTVQTEELGPVYLATKTLKGTDTRFKQQLDVGDFLKTEDGRTFTIATVADQETLTLTAASPLPINGVLHTTPYADTKSRITEARVKVVSTTTATDTGLYVTGKANSRLYTLSLQFVATVPTVRLLDTGPLGLSLLDVAFDWADGNFHSYRMTADGGADNLVLSIDDAVAGNVALSAFVSSPAAKDLVFGHSNGSTVAAWDTISHIWTPPPLLSKRTLGIWLGNDREDIDNWQIPRTDGLSVPNTSTSAVVQQMDWTSPIEVRVHRDPTFGVSLYRPDLPNPPWHTGPEFNSEYTDPTQAWVNVVETHLPEQKGELFGSVAFGALDPQSISYQAWDYVRYRIYQWPDVDYRSPEHHVLNYAHQIGSTELFEQTDAESVVVEALDNRTVTMLPTGIYAQSVFKVLDDGNLVSANYWSFDPQTQTVMLGYDANGFPVTFSSDHAAITLIFVPGGPVTQTYLANVPFLKTATLLNEGTPPFVLDQAQNITRSVIAGGIILDGTQFIDNTPYNTLSFTPPFTDVPEIGTSNAPPFLLDPPTPALYQDVAVYEVDNGAQSNLIAIADDGPVTFDFSAVIGPNTLAIGPQFCEGTAPVPREPPWAQAGLFPAGPTSTMGVLRAAGGPSTVGIQNDGMGGITVWSTSGKLGPAGLFILAPTKNNGVGQQVTIYQNGVPIFP